MNKPKNARSMNEVPDFPMDLVPDRRATVGFDSEVNQVVRDGFVFTAGTF
ncbi:hypothetical protein PHLCEN_2v3270 [Hermanssonia centrifuga]|uniref:Uncharacterized protein n=1 Tax=Hermanssonia centrifuga TaxID=98765 RepID=A0A2R6QUG9_9APHY|nr:hypothetical protein PHLCEN_2v3270 [Hermanssonia centrifuga]